MKSFWNAIHDSLHHTPAIILATLCSVGIAFLWGSNIGALYPVVEMTLNGESIQSWLEKGVQGSDKQIARLEQELQDAPVRFKDRNASELASEENRINRLIAGQESSRSWRQWTVRLADRYGCDLIGIQYQQGLKDLLPASDLVEGMLNDSKRPPVTAEGSSRVLYKGRPLVHFNEVDECAGLDGLLTQRVHAALGEPVENTLHDIRWGDWDQSRSTDQWVWVFEISGGAPPAHFVKGWKGAEGFRQPPMYFRLGGSTLAGVSKPGEIVWSRIWVDGTGPQEKLRMDIGRAEVVALPDVETRRRLEATTKQWPIMHAVTYGVSRDQMMARHKANHVQVAYATSAAAADRAALLKAAVARNLGIEVAFCGTRSHGATAAARWDG